MVISGGTRSPVSKAVYGSTAQGALIELPCPVTYVHNSSSESIVYDRLLIPEFAILVVSGAHNTGPLPIEEVDPIAVKFPSSCLGE